jgi:hypothetical protein
MTAFHEAVEYYVQGLHARGFTRRAMHHAFQSYIHDNWKPFPHQQAELSKWFQALLDRTFLAGAKKPSVPNEPGDSSKGTLLCGLDAINHIMLNQGRMPITRDILDDIADNVAALEAMVSPEATHCMPNEQGNYHVTVMSIALKQLADMYVKVWSPNSNEDPPPVAYVLGNGSHWQALVNEPDGWFVRDKKSFKVHNLKNYLEVCNRRGMVFSLAKEPSKTGGDMDWEGPAHSNK